MKSTAFLDQYEVVKVATISSYEKQVELREPDWRGAIKRRFRWPKFRFEYGRWCYVVHPVEGGNDHCWWEWETP